LPRIKEIKSDLPVIFLSAAEVPFSGHDPVNKDEDDVWWRNLEIRTVKSPLRPYMDEEQYRELLDKLGIKGGLPSIALSGDYGPNLLAETWRYGKAAETIAQTEKFDVIHGHDWTSVMACVRAKRVSGKPFVYHAHALEFDRSGENINRIVYDLEKYGMTMADQVIAVSYYTKRTIVSRYGISPEKITVVHNAVSRRESGALVRSEEKIGGKIVLFLGRITFQKGPDYFVEAASYVLKNIPGVRFVMAGSGDMMPRMMERVAELQMGAHFSFPGFLHGEDVERMYAMSDLYVMPSVSEPFGISPLEAMLYDVPVIISRQSGVAEILHHALKVDFWNVKELADKMIALLNYPALGNEMSGHAREELKNIRWERAGEKIVSVYRQALIA
jgi:glycosyltransferase involved in cell wall biosynthesis